MLAFFACIVIGYLLGCFSTGLLLSGREGVDIRKEGSKSTGSTNVTRVMGIRHGALTFLGDSLKGLVSVLIGSLLMGRNGAILAGLFTVIGHNWPVFYQFKGGKGIASSCGILLYLFPVEALVAIALAIAVIFLLRYVSVGSLVLLSAVALQSAFTRPLWPDIAFTFLLLIIGIWRHRANISRLIQGTENKFSIKK